MKPNFYRIGVGVKDFGERLAHAGFPKIVAIAVRNIGLAIMRRA
jgi:hypothetical protein